MSIERNMRVAHWKPPIFIWVKSYESIEKTGLKVDTRKICYYDFCSTSFIGENTPLKNRSHSEIYELFFRLRAEALRSALFPYLRPPSLLNSVHKRRQASLLITSLSNKWALRVARDWAEWAAGEITGALKSGGQLRICYGNCRAWWPRALMPGEHARVYWNPRFLWKNLI